MNTAQPRRMDPALREARARRKAPPDPTRIGERCDRADTSEEAASALGHAMAWVEELACMPHLGWDGEHAVAEALRSLRVVHRFLRRAKRGAR